MDVESDEKPSEAFEKEMEEIVKELPTVRIEAPTQVRFSEEARAQREMRLLDYRFFLSLILVLGYLILLGVPLYRGQEDLLKTIASTLSGPVGAVLGYYFGVKRREET